MVNIQIHYGYLPHPLLHFPLLFPISEFEFEFLSENSFPFEMVSMDAKTECHGSMHMETQVNLCSTLKQARRLKYVYYEYVSKGYACKE